MNGIKEGISVEEALKQIREGRQVILVDDEDRENEGDLCMAAQFCRPEDINFMAKFGRGLICLTMTRERIEELGLPKMAERNQSRFGTNFHVSIEAREGVTTGISAADRACTIQAAISAQAGPSNLVSPGHIFPLGAVDGGVLVRTGQTEGSVDLARLAGVEPAGVICEIMKEDGSMARRPDLEVFAAEHDLGILTIAQLIEFRLQREAQIRAASEMMVTPRGLNSAFRLVVFTSEVTSAQHVALVLGDVSEAKDVLVRVHRANVLTDVLDVGPHNGKVFQVLRRIEREGAGVLVYVLPENLNLVAQADEIKNGKRAVDGVDTPPVLRELGLGAQVLRSLGLSKIRLITDNPKRLVGLSGHGLEVVDRVPFKDL
ncbi:MAG: 3,4-dihydroxy-2-butanone-4-phosphate synthase [Deltaproteobacteria bacterium]|nr:3,4-dihydroxy-2-butanone-4-phosphate synthase [Deltaproteobacteria bacterium]